MVILFFTSLLIVFTQVYTFGLFPSYWLILAYLRFSPLSLPQPLLLLLNFLPFFLVAYLLFRRFLPSSVKLLPQILLFTLIFVSPWALQLVSDAPLFALFSQPRTNLAPSQYGFYTDIHRQADLVALTPFVGKLFYNKYVTVFRHLWQSAAALLDWDRYIFISSSGKAPLGSHYYPQLTLFELPILLYGLYLLLKRRRYLLFALPFIAAFATAIISAPAAPLGYQADPGWPVWFALSLIMVITLPEIFKQSKTLILACLFLLLFRLTLVNVSFTDNTSAKQTFLAYQRLSQALVSLPQSLNPMPQVTITDRLGQPHVYLTYFGAISQSDYLAADRPGLPQDKFGLSQPPQIANFTFRSFVFEISTPGYWVEFPENFPKLEENQSVVSITSSPPFLIVQTQ